MKLLLDTHILLWWLDDHPSLPAKARKLIADPANMVFISAVSMWEMWLKQSLDKLHLPSNFEARLAREAFESLPLTAAHAREVAGLPWHHRDPFDRMLIAQSRVEELTFLTANESVVAYGGAILLAI